MNDEQLDWYLMIVFEGKKLRGIYRIVEGPFVNPEAPVFGTQIAVVEPTSKRRAQTRITVKVRKIFNLKIGSAVRVWHSKYGFAATKTGKRHR